MELESYRLEARSAFHIGQPGIGQEAVGNYLPSDTLFGAICMAALALFDSETQEKWLDEFKTNPPCLFSSAFPYYDKWLFFPRPEIPALIGDARAKNYRKVKFVSETVYRNLLEGAYDSLKKVRPWDGEDLWFDEDEKIDNLPDQLWKTELAPHVAVDRVTSRSALYYSGRLFFRPGGGLHFLVHWLDRDREIKSGLSAHRFLQACLGYLSDTGIGGDRSSGHGQFVFPAAPGSLTFPDDTDGFYTTLSLYHPTTKEWEDLRQQEGIAYNLVQRVGWISLPGYTTLQRRPVWMLAEGACLRFGEKRDSTALGDLADVTPDWKQAPAPESEPKTIYRYGRALALPLKG